MPRVEGYTGTGGGISRIRRAAIPPEGELARFGPRGAYLLPSVSGEPYIRQLNRFIAGNRPVSPTYSAALDRLFPGGWGPVPNVAVSGGYGVGEPTGVPPPPPDDGGDGGWPAPAPWNVNLRFPESPFRQWFTQNVPWYNPLGSLAEGQVAGLSPEIANQLLVLNAMLPFLGQEDVGPMARFLAMATGGGTGPFAGYLQAPPVGSPVRQQVGEARRLEDALAVARLLAEPGARALSEGVLGAGLSEIGAGGRPDGILGPQEIVARSRAGQMRFLGGLGGFGQGPGAGIFPFLERLALPGQLRPTPGQLVRTDGGYQVAPQPRFLVG